MKIPHRAGKVRLGNEGKELRGYRVDGDLLAGENPVALGQCGNRGKDIVRVGAAAAAVIGEEKRLGPTVVNVRNVQRATDRRAEMVLIVVGFLFRLPVQ